MGIDEQLAALSPVKRELLERWMAEEEPVPGAFAASAEYVAPRDEPERALAEIWQCQLEVERVGIDDDYFELGGDSVRAILIVGHAQLAGIFFEVQELFELRTVRALAAHASVGEPVAARGAAQSAPDVLPLTPLQEGMLYHAVGGSAPGSYLVQVQCRLTGRLDVPAFRAAWQAVYEHTPALRIVIHWRDGERPRQSTYSGDPLRFTYIDDVGAPPASREREFARLLEADRLEGFDLEHGPLMRLTVMAAGPDVHRCVWTYHHLVLDGWSQQLVLRDVFDCYLRLTSGAEAAPRTRPPFTDYLSWLAERPETDEDAWREHFAGVRRATRIAGRGCVDGRVVTVARPRVDVTFPAELGRRLNSYARERGLTLATLVHGSWASLLSELCDQDDIIFGSTVSGRPAELPGASDCVGMFVNTLPLRVRFEGERNAPDWLRDVQSRLTALRVNQHVALSRIERAAGLGYGAGLFDHILVVENFPTWIGPGSKIAGLVLEELSVLVDEGYPLVVEFAPGPIPVLRARYDPGRMDRLEVEGALRALIRWLEELLARPAVPLGMLRDAAGAARNEWCERQLSARRNADRDRLGAARRRVLPAAESRS